MSNYQDRINDVMRAFVLGVFVLSFCVIAAHLVAGALRVSGTCS
jgi:hypothetical protein